jgi:hypothetical protein
VFRPIRRQSGDGDDRFNPLTAVDAYMHPEKAAGVDYGRAYARLAIVSIEYTRQ